MCYQPERPRAEFESLKVLVGFFSFLAFLNPLQISVNQVFARKILGSWGLIPRTFNPQTRTDVQLETKIAM